MTRPQEAGGRAVVTDRVDLRTLLLLLGQLALIVLLIRTYRIETRAFFLVAVLFSVGFAVHALLPLRWRLPFFALLSLAALPLVLGIQNAVFLVLVGMGLIAIARAPVSIRLRVLMLVVVGGALAFGRAEVFAAPSSAGFWAVLGSMFMFRLVLYVHAIRYSGQQPSWTQTIAYFFMLPNACFPLFPVVDYNTFVKNYYDARAADTYQTGMSWIARGLLHLILYRFVYMELTLDPTQLEDFGQLVQYLLSTFLLYLRVSGQFHLAVGVLYLFGFRLPETHKLYYLASSFTDFWRRINIYWKDFMMKLVYYPSFFRLRRLGETKAMVAATVLVFLATWALHSYQWFWLRGGFPITAPDVLFWGLLAALVVVTTLREARRGRKRALSARPAWSLSRAAATVGTFAGICVLWSLWSAESVFEWLDMWRAGARVRSGDLLAFVALVGVGFAVAGRSWDASPVAPTGSQPWWRLAPVRTTALLMVIILVGQPPVHDLAGPHVANAIVTLRNPTLNARDVALQHKGYYEKLDNVGRLDAQLWEVQAQVPPDWVPFVATPLHRSRPGALAGNDLLPSAEAFAAGTVMHTNQWGMRDREYTRAKPPGTFRIAVLGSSYVMGTGVPDDQVFEQLLEARLNNELSDAEQRPIEVLNFGLSGYSVLQQMELLEERVFDFEPDVVMFTMDALVNQWVSRDLVRVTRGGVRVPYPELQQLLERAGLDAVAGETGAPIPFEVVRNTLRRFGVRSRMPWPESEARVRGIVDATVEWSLGRAAAQIRAHGAVPVMIGLDVVTGLSLQAPDALTVARDVGFEVIDIFDVYDGYAADSLRIAPWDDHPNARASRLIADRLFQELQQRANALRLPGRGA